MLGPIVMRLALALVALVVSVGCRAPVRLQPTSEVSVIEAALRVVPVRPNDVRIILHDDLSSSGPALIAELSALREQLPGSLIFADAASARAHCDALADRSLCVRLAVRALVRDGATWTASVSKSVLGGCGHQNYDVELITTGLHVDVRAVFVGEHGSCGLRSPPGR